MSQIVHIQTTIQTVFGVLDEDGNAIPQEPVVVRIARFSPDAFTEAQQVIAQARDDAATNIDAVLTDDRHVIARDRMR